MSMIKVMAKAKARRDKYYAEYQSTENKLGLVARLAKKYKVSPARMSQILARAKEA